MRLSFYRKWPYSPSSQASSKMDIGEAVVLMGDLWED